MPHFISNDLWCPDLVLTSRGPLCEWSLGFQRAIIPWCRSNRERCKEVESYSKVSNKKPSTFFSTIFFHLSEPLNILLLVKFLIKQLSTELKLCRNRQEESKSQRKSRLLNFKMEMYHCYQHNSVPSLCSGLLKTVKLGS